MRLTELILILLISKWTFGQSNIYGSYYSRINGTIELKSDSTFLHQYRFDLSSSWTTGKWSVKNDTVYLETIPIMDTLQIRNEEGKVVRDSLVLSSDQKADRIEQIEFVASTISGGGQNRIKPPKKLYRKRNKLYLINEDGTLDMRKIRGIRTNRKYKTYFKKIRE